MWTEKQAAALSKWPADGTPPLATTPEPDFGATLGLSSKSVDRHWGGFYIVHSISGDLEKEKGNQANELYLQVVGLAGF